MSRINRVVHVGLQLNPMELQVHLLLTRVYLGLFTGTVYDAGNRNRSGRPGGCRTDNLTNTNFYVHVTSTFVNVK